MAMDYVALFLLEERITIIAMAGWQALKIYPSRAAKGENTIIYSTCVVVSMKVCLHAEFPALQSHIKQHNAKF